MHLAFEVFVVYTKGGREVSVGRERRGGVLSHPEELSAGSGEEVTE